LLRFSLRERGFLAPDQKPGHLPGSAYSRRTAEALQEDGGGGGGIDSRVGCGNLKMLFSGGSRAREGGTMASLNKVILIGNLGRDPEVKYTQGGTAVANLSVATNETWTDRSGEKQERTEWHRVVVWGKQAEICGEHLTKGKQVFVEGSLQTRSWDDKDGNKRYTTEVKAMRVLMLGRPEGGRVETEMPPGPEAGAAMNDEEVPF